MEQPQPEEDDGPTVTHVVEKDELEALVAQATAGDGRQAHIVFDRFKAIVRTLDASRQLVACCIDLHQVWRDPSAILAWVRLASHALPCIGRAQHAR